MLSRQALPASTATAEDDDRPAAFVSWVTCATKHCLHRGAWVTNAGPVARDFADREILSPSPVPADDRVPLPESTVVPGGTGEPFVVNRGERPDR